MRHRILIAAVVVSTSVLALAMDGAVAGANTTRKFQHIRELAATYLPCRSLGIAIPVDNTPVGSYPPAIIDRFKAKVSRAERTLIQSLSPSACLTASTQDVTHGRWSIVVFISHQLTQSNQTLLLNRDRSFFARSDAFTSEAS